MCDSRYCKLYNIIILNIFRLFEAKQMNRFFLIIAVGIFGYGLSAQPLYDDFEGNGNIFTWQGDFCALDENKANPFQQGINLSDTVLEYHDQGGQFANIRFDAGQYLDMANSHVFELKIYVPSSGITGNQPNQISLKLQNNNLGSPWFTQTEIIKPLVLDQWQTIQFNFATDPYINFDVNSPPPVQRTDFNRVLIQINGENNYDQVLAYIDDFNYPDATAVPYTPIYNALVWSDEFNGNGMIDTSKWFHETILPNGNSWWNNEQQHYTDRLVNSNQNNGSLHVIARNETFTDQGVTKSYTSARLNSKFAFTYGRIEVRANLPTGDGTWPAIWMLGKNFDEMTNGSYWDQQGFGSLPWPNCGEIDIMEHWGSNQNYISSAIHTPSSYGATVNHDGRVIPGVSDGFHVYQAEWTPDRIVFTVDDIVHYVYEPAVQDSSTWPFDAPQFILLNIAIDPSISSSFTQDTLEIDYVRVYQDSNTVGVIESEQTSIQFYPNPVDHQLNFTLPQYDQTVIKYEVYNYLGVKITEGATDVVNGKGELDGLSFLPPGLYAIHLRTRESEFMLKFMKK